MTDMTGISWALLAEGAPDPRAGLVSTGGMILLMGVMFYFALWRPQQKKAKEHEALIKSLKPGDKVITSGGICGVVVSVKEKTASVRSADAKFELLKSAITEIVERAEGSSSSN